MITLVLGCNHRTAPLAVREKLALSDQQARDALERLRETHRDCESLLLSTCNRVELYVARPHRGQPSQRDLLEWLAQWRGLQVDQIAGLMYHYMGTAALRHCFRVVSSLDSMVLGESQIVGQIRQALATADEVGTVGPTLRNMFSRAMVVARRVRAETDIGAGRASVGSVAVDFARQIFSELKDRVVLMIGAGKMGQTTVRHLMTQEGVRVLITNRTAAKAQETAAALGGQAVPFEELSDALVKADVVISSTGADEPILRRADLEPVLKRRSYRPILLIDIAVPRDIDPDVTDLDQVYLHNVDDLQSAADAVLADRQNELAACNALVEQELLSYLQQQGSRSVGPLIQDLNTWLDDLGEQELIRALPKLSGDAEKDEQVLRQFKHRLVRKLLHNPVQRLNKRAGDGSAAVYAQVIRELFDIEEEG